MSFTLRGTRGADSIRGGNGNDIILGEGGADRLFGGAGNDILSFNSLLDAAAAESIGGGAGTDTLRLTGAATNGLLSLGGRASELEAVLLSATGAHSIAFAAGSEAAFTDGVIRVTAPSASRLTVNASAIGPEGRLEATGTRGADLLIGGAGNDTFAGNGGADALLGNAGDDLFLFASTSHLAGAAAIEGGEGLDTLRLSGTVSGTLGFANALGLEVLQLAGTGRHSFSLGAGAANAFTDGVVTVLAGGTGGVVLNASGIGAGARLLATGSAAADTVTGGAGDDVIRGGGGADRLIGNAGNDLFVVANLAATVDGGAGTDTVQVMGDVSGALGRGLLSNIESLELMGAGEQVVALQTSLAQAFAGGAMAVSATSAARLDLDASLLLATQRLSATGGAGEDRFVAGRAADSFAGGEGNDRFEFSAGDGADVVRDFQPHGHEPGPEARIGFDDIGQTWNYQLYSGYAGFNWSNMFAGSTQYSWWGGHRWEYLSASSGPNVAVTGSYSSPWNYPATQSGAFSRAEAFDLVSLNMAAATNWYGYQPSSVAITGLLDGVVVGSRTVAINNSTQRIELDSSFDRVNEIRFAPNTGQVVLDDIVWATEGPEVPRDKLVFAGMTQADIEAMLDTAGEVNGNTVLFYNGGADQVTLQGVAKSQLSLSDFVWG